MYPVLHNKVVRVLGLLAVVTAGLLIGSLYSQGTPPYQNVKVYGRSLMVDFDRDGSYIPYFIKGVSYTPYPIGRHPADTGWPAVDPRPNNFLDDPQILARDFTLLKNMNSNTIRIWHGQDATGPDGSFPVKLTQQTLNSAEQNKLKVIAGFWVAPLGENLCVGGSSQYNTLIDVTSPTVRNDLKTRFGNYVTAFKDHEAILFWAIGNENNLGLNPNDPIQIQAWYSLVNEMGQVAHQIEGANFHPVAIVNGDLGFIGASSAAADDSQLTYIDIWGASAYRGQSFGALFTDYVAKSSKPLWISEYGVDAWKAHEVSPMEDQDAQSSWLGLLADEIVANSMTTIGGTVMEYSDQWWRPSASLCTGSAVTCNLAQGQEAISAMDTSCPADGTMDFVPASPDSVFNPEWYGLMKISANPLDPKGADIMKPRAAYFTLQDKFAVQQPGYTMAFNDIFTRAASTTVGNNWLETAGNMQIINNEITNTVTGASIMVQPQLFGGKQSVSVDLASINNNGGPKMGVVLRYQNPTNYYLIYRAAGGSSQLRISKVVNGVETILKIGSISNPVVNSFYTLKGSVDANVLQLDLGSTKLTINDSTFSSGIPGIYISTTGTYLHRADNVVMSLSTIYTNRPPVVNAGADKTAAVGTAVSFSGSATDLDNDPLTYTWNFGDASSAAGATASHTYTVPGNYTVLLNAYDGKLNDTDSMIVDVVNNAPPILTSIGNQSVDENAPLSFTISATDADASQTLTYSASGLPTGASFNPTTRTFAWTPQYSQSGIYSATFSVTDGYITDSETIAITVNDLNRPPTANAGADKTATAGTTVAFTATATDPDGDTLTYAWDFGDGQTGTGASTSHAYASNGTYTVTLTVNDGVAAAMDTALVTISSCSYTNFSRCSTLSASTTYATSLTSDKAADGSTSSRWAAATADINGSWLVVDMGFPRAINKIVLKEYLTKVTGHAVQSWDGTNWQPLATGTTIGASKTHAFATISTQKVRLLITSATAAASMFEFEIYALGGGAPVLNPIGNQSLSENSPFSLTVSASDPDGNPVTYSATGLPTGSTFNATTKIFSWTPGYTHAGTYNVTFSVNDGIWPATTETVVLTVANTNRPPTANAGTEVKTTNVGTALTLSGTGSDPDSGTTLTYSWDFGNGVSGTGATASYVYLAPGTYTATLSVSDGIATTTDTTVVTVTACPHTNFARCSNASASTIYSVSFTADKASDASTSSRWAASTTNVNGSWLAMDFGVAKTFDKVVLKEYTAKVTAHTLQSWDGTAWQNIMTGTTIGSAKTHTFNAVTSQKVRLLVNSTPSAASIYEFEVYYSNNNLPPVMTAIPNKTVNENQSVNFTVSATDPETSTLTYSAASLPSGSTFNAATRAFSWTPSYSQSGNYSVTFSVSDGSLTDSETASITIKNVNRAPVFNPIPNQVVNVGEHLTVPISATDADGDPLSYDFVSVPLHGGFYYPTNSFTFSPQPGQGGNYNVTVKVTDGIATVNKTFVVKVNRAPLMNASVTYGPGNPTVSYIATASTDPDNDPLTYSWNFGDGMTSTAASGNHTYSTPGAYTVTLVISDGSLTASTNLDVTVTANQPPVLLPVGNHTVVENDNLSIALGGSDPEYHPTTYSASGLPAGATFHIATAFFSWTPTYAQAGSYNVTFAVSDGQATDSETITITVNNINRPPTANAGADVFAQLNNPVTFLGSGSDPDGDPVTYSWNFGDGTTGTGSSPAHTYLTSGSKTVTLTVSDGTLSITDTMIVSVGAGTSQVTLNPIGNKTVSENALLTFTISASNVSGAPITYTSAFLPTGAQFNETTRTFSWTPTYTQAGTYYVNLEANDGASIDNEMVMITVNNVNRVPTANAGPDKTGGSGQTISFNGATSSDPDGDTLSYSWNFGDGTAVSTSGQPQHIFASAGNYTVTLTVSDGSLTASDTALVAISANTAPILNPIGKKTTGRNQALVFIVSATDTQGDVLTYSTATLPTGAVFNASTQTFSWQPSYDQVGNYNVTFTVSDGALTDSEIVTIEVVPTGDPIADAGPDKAALVGTPVVFEGGGTISGVDMGETGQSLDFSWDFGDGGTDYGSSVAHTYAQPGVFTVVMTAINGTATDTDELIVTVSPVSAPPVLNAIGNKTVNKNNSLSFTIAATDSDSQVISYETSALPPGAQFSQQARTFSWTPIAGDVGNHAVTFTASDGTLTDSETITITVTNYASPVANAGPDQTISLGAPVSLSGANSSFPEGGGIGTLGFNWNFGDGTATASGMNQTHTYAQAGVYTVILTVSGPSGTLPDTDEAIITVTPANGPPILSSIGPKTVSESQTLTFSVSATDPNGDPLTYSATSLPDGATFNASTKTFKWMPSYSQSGSQTVNFAVSDGTNSDSEAVTITVNDVSNFAYEGFGTSTPGGTGQSVVYVTNLNDSGTGSLRTALSAGNRIINFQVAGTINLLSDIQITKPYITIDGFTAGPNGITLTGYGLIIRGPGATGKTGHDIIIRGLRIRNSATDGIWVTDAAYNIVIDRVSISGSFDGNLDITRTNTKDVTVSNSIITQAAGEEKNMLLAFGSTRMTLHHNILIDSNQRSPQVTFDDATFTQDTDTTLDMRNNLIWDWRNTYGTRIRYGARANLVNNYYNADGGDVEDAIVVCTGLAVDADCDNATNNIARAYVSGNINVGGPDENTGETTESAAFNASPVVTTDALTGACQALSTAGVRPLDATDQAHLNTVSLSCP